ncbi:class I adenylate-forming enzyme family protein [Microbulbifer sp. SAOS-129_SWC]|uniref:class I adenylate-forming enzyme family protein n=1 Tax=Microbulbifer sp. SAOS-129_SWC TaxID=3145235 RepID=UPI0032165E65
MSYALIALALALFGYLLFAGARLGYIGRLALLAGWDDRVDRALEFAARRHGERKLIELAQPLAWHTEQQWSAPQLLAMAKRLSACWHQLGINEGDRVAIYKANQFDYFLFSVAALRIGAIAVPINGNVAPEIAAGYIERMGARLLITDNGGWRKLATADGERPVTTLEQVVLADAPLHGASAPPWLHSLAELLTRELSPAPVRSRGGADPLYIVHTSGTTGVPKGVILKQQGIAQSLRSIVLFNPVSTRDLACFALPLNHQVSHLYLHGVLLMGVRCIVDSELAAADLMQLLQRRKPTVFFSFPVTYTRLIEAGATDLDLDSLRIWGTTADASHEVQQRAFLPHGSFFKRLGIPVRGSLFVDGLGSSEVGIAALLRIATPWTKNFARRVGRRTPLGPQIRIADAAGNPVPRGEVGRLMIRGISMFGGYWNAHDVFYSSTRDGWWFTGDLVRLGDDGEVVHLDREVDVMHTASGPVYTLPLEETVLKHPAVLDTSVFGVRPRSGAREVPAAVVAPRRGARIADVETLRRELNRQLPEAQQLAHLWLLDWQAFPMGATGKTLKRRLREQYNQLLQCPGQRQADDRESAPCEIRALQPA